MATKSEVININLRHSDDLCKLAELLGYRDKHGQLQCTNGAFVSSLMSFFDDNPGAIEAVHDFVMDKIDSYDLDEEDEGDEA